MFHSGQWNDVSDICKAYRPRGIEVLADLTQQVGYAEVDVKAMGVSAAAFSLHKGLNCPTGFAALYVDPNFIIPSDPTPPIVGYGAVNNVRADLLVPKDDIIYHSNAQRYEHLNLSFINAIAAKAYLTLYLDFMGPSVVQEHLFHLGTVLKDVRKRLGVAIVGSATQKKHAPHLYIPKPHDPRWIVLLKEHNTFVTQYRLGIRVSVGFYNNSSDVKKLAGVLRLSLDTGYPTP